MGFLQFCNTTNTDAVPSLDMNALQQQQLQEFELYVIRLRNGEWADNLAVQGIKIMRSWPTLWAWWLIDRKTRSQLEGILIRGYYRKMAGLPEISIIS